MTEPSDEKTKLLQFLEEARKRKDQKQVDNVDEEYTTLKNLLGLKADEDIHPFDCCAMAQDQAWEKWLEMTNRADRVKIPNFAFEYKSSLLPFFQAITTWLQAITECLDMLVSSIEEGEEEEKKEENIDEVAVDEAGQPIEVKLPVDEISNISGEANGTRS